MKLDRDNLIENLQKHKLQIIFTKTGGELRNMFCTLREDCVPDGSKFKKATKKKDIENLISAWDLEKNGWRSFHCDKIAAVLQLEDDGK